MNRVFFLSLIAVSLGAITCNPGTVYLKITKHAQNWGSEESHKILSGSTVLVTSPTYANYETRTDEYCIAESANLQYTMVLMDSASDSWSTGSYITVYNIDDIIMFNFRLLIVNELTFPLSLYTPIHKGETWKYATTLQTGWNTLTFQDTTWTESSGQITVSSITYYTRKSFTGIANLAAVELGAFYRDGLIAYINGEEVWRDNMPSGEVTASTPASGGYTESQFRKVIRNGAILTASTGVVAIEYHAVSSQSVFVFDAYLAVFAASVPVDEAVDNNCFIAGMESITTITSDTVSTNPPNAYDYGSSTYLYNSNVSTNHPWLRYTFQDSYFIQTNGWMIFAYSSLNNLPLIYDVEYSTSNSVTAPFTSLGTMTGDTHVLNKHTYHLVHFMSDNARQFKISVTQTSSNILYLYEFYPVTCNIPTPTSLPMEPANTVVYAGIDEILIQSPYMGLSDCVLQGTLPEGVTMTGCTISGIARNTIAATTYTISSPSHNNISGNFVITVNACAGAGVEIVRTYGTSASSEYYEIVNMNGSVIERVTGVTNSVTVTTRKCLSTLNFMIDTGSSSSSRYWASGSYITVYSLLDGEKEMILRTRYDQMTSIPSSNTISINRLVPPVSTWSYIMSNPGANWYSMDTSSWATGKKGEFTAGTTQYQVYRTTFNVGSLENIAAFSLALRYKYGVIVYINDNEVFRNHVSSGSSDLASVTSTNSYSTVQYRYVSLPLRTIPVTESSTTIPAVNYLSANSNNNKLSIALIANSASSTEVVFDASLRLIGGNESDRVLDFTASSSGISGTASNAFSKYYGNNVYYTSCADNYLELKYENDRREWISSLTVVNYYNTLQDPVDGFILLAKNSNDADWVTLSTLTNLKWWIKRQTKRIYFVNNKPYNMYRLKNINSGDATKCTWRINDIIFFSDSTIQTVSTLSYASQDAYLNIEMAELFPTGNELKSGFSVEPSLPTGLFLDPADGVVMGTATELKAKQTYSVKAVTVGGEPVSTTFQLGVFVCKDGKSLVTWVISGDSYPKENSYAVFEGRGTSGNLIMSRNEFSYSNTLVYVDHCYPFGIYTIRGDDTLDGWFWPHGWHETVDVGAFPIQVGHLPSDPKPIFMTQTFSSLMPFQVEHTEDWKVYKDSNALPEDWMQLSYAASEFSPSKASEIGNAPVTTVYIRKTFNIPSLTDYRVLNVRVNYGGGLVAYFNGNRVARFNMPETFDASTPGTAEHDTTTFSKFHVILQLNNAVGGSAPDNNILAYELHRPAGQSTSIPIVFDSTGVFDVSDGCSVVVDSYISTIAFEDGKEAGEGKDASNLFDVISTTNMAITNTQGFKVRWIVENLEGSNWNQYSVFPSTSGTSYGFTISGRLSELDEWNVLDTQSGVSLTSRTKKSFASSAGLARFTQFQWELKTAGSAAQSFSEILFEYKPATGTICPGDSVYPSVGDGDISPARCAEGYTGYRYRECANGILNPTVNNDKCVMKPIEEFTYDKLTYIFIQGIYMETEAPLYKNIVESFTTDDRLPAGLSLDESTGVISGTATNVVGQSTYRIYASNQRGTEYSDIILSVRAAVCNPTGDFPQTKAGETAVFQCSERGNYMGTLTRACRLGATDGEWEKTRGSCVSVMLIAILVIVVIIVVIIVVLVLIRATKKTKTVGGVKKGNSSSSSSAKGSSVANKKVSAKSSASSAKKPSSAKAVKV